ncbi:MAG: N-acetylmuramic acid 6-phosphate etherase [Clostridia bacterium]|nr:N-acetylmuramic acid 6-phosphate etherase [Clostridia bacterium]
MIKTEQRNPKTMHIDKASTAEMLEMIQNENLNAVYAVKDALSAVEKACDAIVDGMEQGGRLIYIGAGTSGRLGVLDASECPPTFGVADDKVIGIIAGGDKCLRYASENAEDMGEAGVMDLSAYHPDEKDVVVGISVAGEADYVVKALEFAKKSGSITVGLTSNADSALAKKSDIAIVTDTGAEVITGSTRMKAGTAQKMVLNMLSTVAMIQMGYVYENLMINLKPVNKKLMDRTIRIVQDILNCDIETAETLLKNNDWNIRKAIECRKIPNKGA